RDVSQFPIMNFRALLSTYFLLAALTSSVGAGGVAPEASLASRLRGHRRLSVPVQQSVVTASGRSSSSGGRIRKAPKALSALIQVSVDSDGDADVLAALLGEGAFDDMF
ncbi:unnamed protein product, partial [Polarella glacialis]